MRGLFFTALFRLATAVLAEAADIGPADTSKPLFRAPPSAAQSAFLERVSFAVAQQFTHYGTLQFEGEEVANPTRQYLDSSITQIAGSYSHYATIRSAAQRAADLSLIRATGRLRD